MSRLLNSLSAVLLLGLVISLIVFFNQRTVESVSCLIESNPCPESIISSLHSLKGEPFFFSDLEIQASTALQADPSHRVAEIQKEWPATVIVQLQPSLPIYKVVLSNGEMTLITAEGFFVPKVSDAQVNVPLVHFIGDIELEETRVNAVTHERIKVLLHGLEVEKIAFQELELQKENLVLIILDNKIAIVSLETPVYDAKRLSLVLKELEPDKLESVREIDLRYNFPVLRTETTIARQKTQ